MPLARLQLGLPTREGEEQNLNQLGKKFKNPLVPQFPLTEPAFFFTYQQKECLPSN
jgi:hypothetical protein